VQKGKFRVRHAVVSGNKGSSLSIIISLMILFLFRSPVFGEELDLGWLIDEALKNNREILMVTDKAAAAEHRIMPAQSLPDPMLTFGYQNTSLSTYNYNKDDNSYWIVSASQMFPYPGKRELKGDMAKADAEGQKAYLDALRLRVISRIKELYNDLFLAYKMIDILQEKIDLFTRVEDAALARYSTGMGPQQEVVMAQTEKYMILERQVMFRQKIQALEAMLNLTVGREPTAPLGRPKQPESTKSDITLDELTKRAYEASPEIRVKEKMIAAAEAKLGMAKKEYYPDVTINAGVNQAGPDFMSMYMLTASVNVPLYFKTKQEPAVKEATASLSETKRDLEATKLMLAATLRDNYSMLTTADKLIDLYDNALIPKSAQDYQLALSGYGTGKIEALTVITRLKAFLDVEILYWTQFVEREKALARITAITGKGLSEAYGK
jgi:cobalt-zinc-cadmium efflux system outer membrane protein